MEKLSLLFITLFMDIGVNAAETSLPAAIKVPQGYVVQLTVYAIGEQIYHCVQNKGEYAWKWHAPQAKLFDPKTHKELGIHGAGPKWKYQDGSGVKGKVMQRTDSPEKSAVPWLLLEASEHDGKGLLTETAYIQRINTRGGLAPLKLCDGNHLGSEEKVPYTSDYIFFK